MENARRTPLEIAEDAVREAEAEFTRNPNDTTDAKVRNARNFVNSIKDFSAKHPDFNRRPPAS